MIICINCSKETKARMDSFLSEDQYRDYSELITVAVENLWILNREVSKKGVLVIGEDLAQLSLSPASSPVERAKSVSAGGSASSPPRQSKVACAPPTPVTPAPVRIPELFLSEGLDELSVFTAEVSPAENTDEIFTLDHWLFGQYNKLLPAKANCRALIRLTAGKKNGTPVDSTAARIAEAATLLGDYLADHDRRHKIGRDDALATAFPRSGPDAEKSRARYANQFVGRANSQNALSGLLWDYRLVGLASENGPLLLPTEQAVRLARLTNPILDGCQTGPTQRFSPEEVAFLLDHICTFVPEEAFAFRTLLQAIADGADTPDKLDEALLVHVPTDTNRSLSASFLTSQRSGALSRMADLGMIARVRRGVRVSYTITPEGKTFILDRGNSIEKENG
jgi:hypothetical protein